jgi:hypothetical protein
MIAEAASLGGLHLLGQSDRSVLSGVQIQGGIDDSWIADGKPGRTCAGESSYAFRSSGGGEFFHDGTRHEHSAEEPR